VRPTRWSKKTDELVRGVAGGCRPRLQSELGNWMDAGPRFQAFVAAHQDKVRKKLNTGDEEARLDVRAELLVAQHVLLDRRFDVSFEAYGATRRGPDLSVAYRTNERFNLEVTRVRSTDGLDVVKLSNVTGAKLRQLVSDVGNVVVIVGEELGLSSDGVSEAARLLRARMAGDVAAHYPRLSGVLVVDDASVQMQTSWWLNREARHAISTAAAAALTACFAR
jgi:hypothetical protein